MNLAIDFGNTYAKIGAFEANEMIDFQVFRNLHEVQMYLLRKRPQKVVISDVAKEKVAFISQMQAMFEVLVFSAQTPIPIQNLYASPETLGTDRLAAVIGANFLYPDQHNLVFSLGTALTYEFINIQKQYLGGGISVGLQMRLQALNHFTARLPLVHHEPYKNEFFGNDTTTCIRNGVVWGMKAEIEGLIHTFAAQFAPLNVILTGGDASFFEKILKTHIFVVPNLVLLGLHQVLKWQENH